ncbi:hypothetical protein BKA65DRAFT_552960 [Rhexocercosporidium sp. MPI-PUGE-AT-0058]|nr:hypothetical protein BKA65DRAFT_552960 [Rhexocercosporidium sp. MPI-PUGE-AT-0058]
MTILARVVDYSKKPSLTERDLVSWGGYGLQSSPCVEGTSSCGDSCCPDTYKCTAAGNHKDFANTIEAICCPTDVDCSGTVRVVKACADNSWGLYHAYWNFCCPLGMVGIYPDGSGLMCLSSSLPIPKDRLASEVIQATIAKGGATTTGGSKTSSVASGTTISSSSTVNSDTGSQFPTGTTDNSSQSPSKASLSKGATIAIAVLASALGLLSILIIGYFWRKKRRSSKVSPSLDPPTAEPVDQLAPAFEAGKGPDSEPVVEAKIVGFQVNELLGKNVLHSNETTELDAPYRAELHDTPRTR